LNDPAEQVQLLETACHRLLMNLEDASLCRALLEGLVAYKSTPLDGFPTGIRTLVWGLARKRMRCASAYWRPMVARAGRSNMSWSRCAIPWPPWEPPWKPETSERNT